MKKMITPTELQTNTVAQDVSGKYDWKKQVYQYDTCKWGTGSNSQQGTLSGSYHLHDDNGTDFFND